MAVAALLLVLPGVAAATLTIQFTGTPAPWAKSTGHDALWLGHMWVDGRKNAADVKALAARLRKSGIRDLYVHSGPFDFDGTLPPAKYAKAADFLKRLRAELPKIRVSAWLGQKVDVGLDLDDAASRQRVLDGARAIMATGFDGVHYNFEPVGDGDTEFLDLLTRTRQVVGEGLLSVSTPQIEPFPLTRPAVRAVIGHDKYWSPAYFQEVVTRADQVAIMTYDSFLPSELLYGGYVVRQSTLALELVPEEKTLLIGAPAYHDHGVEWGDMAESVETAAEGARLALTSHGKQRELFGLALYVDFAATAEDWEEYDRAWLRP
ncbi:membrane protein [Streptosporangium carneum]|uniref:Membrane protein n=1 Tax=Streptosporangium carneum TaxID=47481 RepID=A0A9W6MCK6_9ACTN|nr:membrane protein [Streptosporangium carneum]